MWKLKLLLVLVRVGKFIELLIGWWLKVGIREEGSGRESSSSESIVMLKLLAC